MNGRGLVYQATLHQRQIGSLLQRLLAHGPGHKTAPGTYHERHARRQRRAGSRQHGIGPGCAKINHIEISDLLLASLLKPYRIIV